MYVVSKSADPNRFRDTAGIIYWSIIKKYAEEKSRTPRSLFTITFNTKKKLLKKSKNIIYLNADHLKRKDLLLLSEILKYI